MTLMIMQSCMVWLETRTKVQMPDQILSILAHQENKHWHLITICACEGKLDIAPLL